jgi:hypothetical protein
MASCIQIHKADENTIEAAEAIIKNLTFPKDDLTGLSQFDCCSVHNPYLQRAYQVIEVSHSAVMTHM